MRQDLRRASPWRRATAGWFGYCAVRSPRGVRCPWRLAAGESIFNPFRMLMPKLPSMENLVVSGSKITMESPHLSGYTPDSRPYDLWAKAATQDLTDPDHVELTTLHSKVLMEDKSTIVTLDAR